MSRHLVTTTVADRVCPRCQEMIFVGVSQGITARVDVYPLTTEVEIMALLQGRWVYAMIDHRLHRKVGSPRVGVVLAEHRCGQPLPRTAVTSSEPAPVSDQPPF